jgi:hypothetical protein
LEEFVDGSDDGQIGRSFGKLLGAISVFDRSDDRLQGAAAA